MKSYPTVDAFIAAAQSEAQPKLRELRTLIQKTLPQAEEKIWYGVPFYHQHGEVVGLSVSRHHVSVGFGAKVFPEELRKKVESRGYQTGKCTLQIRFDQKIPGVVLRKIIREKVRLNRSRPRPPPKT